jgi:ribonuclease Y
MTTTIVLALLAVALIIGAFSGYISRKMIAKRRSKNLEAKLAKALSLAKEKGEKILKEKQKEADALIEKAHQEERETRSQIREVEARLSKKEEKIDVHESKLLEKEEGINDRTKKLKLARKEIETLEIEQKEKLEAISGFSSETAKLELIEIIEKEHQEELVSKLRNLEENLEEEIDKKSSELMVIAMQRLASSQATESTTSTIAIPSEDMKGRIIGKEGRNIRALEHLTGVEIIVDDTPGEITISGFSPVRRQIAKLSLEKLMKDGRIQPAKIEEVVDETRKDVNQKIKKAGDAALYELGITGLDPQLTQLIGSLLFRTSYGQNILVHSIEVAHVGAMLAQELGADVNIVKKACLMHDIGKAVDHEIEGTHIEIGRRILKKFGISEDVIKAMQAHHEDYPFESIESRIVQVADALSSSRPGARKDSLENYLKRLKELEDVATGFEGIDKAYAIQAGREIRVFVKPGEVDDMGAIKLSKSIAKRIQDTLTYPGEIKVNVIRENRSINYAK